MSIFAEFKRRNVFRVGLAYLVLSWVVIEVTDVIAPAFGLPDWTLRLVLLIGIAGFPFALFFAWAFEITPEGIRRETDVDRGQSVTHHTARKLDIFAIAMVLLGLALLLADRLIPEKPAGIVAVAPAASGTATTPASDISAPRASNSVPIVAVLPFKATGSDDGGFLAAGLHDDLLTRLARLRAFKVISRTSMMEYADSSKNIRQIGQELGAGFILEGGVQARGARVRINAQLIDARTDQHLWADTYDRALSAENLFDIQAELAGSIAGEMQTTLGESDKALLEEVPTHNTEAYNFYLRGLGVRERASFTENDIEAGIAAFTEAVRLDPKFAQAWAQLSIEYSRKFQVSQAEAQRNVASEALAKAKQALAKAEMLKPALQEVSLARAVYLYRVEREYKQALQVLETLAQHSPLSATALLRKSWLLRRVGRYKEAYQANLEAQKLDPRSVVVAANLADVAYQSGNCPAAARHVSAALALAPESVDIRATAAGYELNCTGNAARASKLLRGLDLASVEPWTLILARIAAEHQGDYQRVLELAKIPQSGAMPINPVSDQLWQVSALRSLGRQEEARQLLDATGERLAVLAEDEFEASYWFSVVMARYQALRGDVRKTLHWLAEDRRRVPLQTNEDRSVEATRHLLYALALTVIGHYTDAIAELAVMLEKPGGFSFVFVDATPDFAPLRTLPGYIALQEQYGTNIPSTSAL